MRAGGREPGAGARGLFAHVRGGGMRRLGTAAGAVILVVLLAHAGPAKASDYRWFWPVELSGSYGLHGPATGGGFGGGLSGVGFGLSLVDITFIAGAVGLGWEYYGVVGGGLRLRPIEMESFTLWFGVDAAVAVDLLECTSVTDPETGEAKEDCDYDHLPTLMPVVGLAYRWRPTEKAWFDLGATIRYVRLFDDRNPLSAHPKADLFDGDGVLFGLYLEVGGIMGEDRETAEHDEAYRSERAGRERWEGEIARGGVTIQMDGDAVEGALDACPLEREDEDGFQDDDGCPDPDNDGDGIVDAWDRCPDEKEVFNGIDDDDGCPDEGQAIVSVEEAEIALRQVVHFDTDSDRIQSRSYPLLEAVARTLHAYPQILLVRVEGHTDDRASDAYNYDLSRRRAASVRDFLIGAGVAPGRLLADGFGETRPVATNTTAAGRQQNRRVVIALLERMPELAVTYYRRMEAEPRVPIALEPPDAALARHARCRWSVISRPGGSSARDPSPVDSPTPAFRPDIAGVYTLGVNVTGPEGAEDHYLRLDVLANEGLRVEMFWNPPEKPEDPTDVDLHLLHPSAGSWFSQGDCFYANCSAAGGRVLPWDAPGTADDPRLDLDDTDGFGPENINISRPVDGRMYVIGVHYFSDDGYGPADVHVKVYCGETSAAPVAWFGPVRLERTDEFWRVASVTWVGGVCAVTPLTLPDGRPDIRGRDDATGRR
ncbi:MAG: OmpA family protein [Myxococcota bacterium]|nr:OmpA family protein [Myxococcota bacterium]